MRDLRMQMVLVLAVVLVATGGSVALATGSGGGLDKPAVEVPSPEVSDFYVVEPSVPVVYVATGLNFPDALVAGPPAALGVGPVLLVRTDSIPPAVQTELARLNPHKIIISGGNDVVSDGVAAELATYTTTGVVERLEGPTRYETAVEVSKANFPAAPIGVAADRSDEDEVILDTCTSYDGLAVVIAPPVSGTVVLHANVQVVLDHVTGTWTQVGVGIGTSPTDCGFEFGYDAWLVEESGTPTGTSYPIVPLTHIAEVDPGINWFYVNGFEQQGAGSSAFFYAGIDAVFYPDP